MLVVFVHGVSSALDLGTPLRRRPVELFGPVVVQPSGRSGRCSEPMAHRVPSPAAGMAGPRSWAVGHGRIKRRPAAARRGRPSSASGPRPFFSRRVGPSPPVIWPPGPALRPGAGPGLHPSGPVRQASWGRPARFSLLTAGCDDDLRGKGGRAAKGVPMAHQGSLELLKIPSPRHSWDLPTQRGWPTPGRMDHPESCRSGSTGLVINSSSDHRRRPPSSRRSPQTPGLLSRSTTTPGRTR
jgi:hypothetical protein